LWDFINEVYIFVYACAFVFESLYEYNSLMTVQIETETCS